MASPLPSVNRGARSLIGTIGVPRLIIVSFLVLLFITAYVNELPIKMMLGNALIRTGMNGILVLALLPTIQGGVGLNFGLPVGVLCGVVGVLIAMEFNVTGFAGLLLSVLVSLPLATVAGIGYGGLLNRVKGQEMMVGTYVGFSAVAGMCIFWLAAPFSNPELIWVVGGQGLRTTLTLRNHFAHILDEFWSCSILGVSVPTGLLAAFLVCCLLVWVLFRTRLGMAITAVGSNPVYARASGIDVARMRTMAVVLSTILGAVGIIVYAQSFGFLQLYLAPLMMAFPAVAAILIGGASTRRATIAHVLIGTLLFQTLLTTSLPVTRSVVQGDISEVARIIIANGMILYALTRGGNSG